MWYRVWPVWPVSLRKTTACWPAILVLTHVTNGAGCILTAVVFEVIVCSLSDHWSTGAQGHRMTSFLQSAHFWLAHTCLCAVTITKVFDTSVKRSVDTYLDWSWFVCVCESFYLLVAHFGTSALVPRVLYSILLFSTSHGFLLLQQDGNSRPRLAPSSARPTHQPSWLGLCEDIPFRQIHYTTNRVPQPPRAHHHRRCSPKSHLWTHYALSPMSQLPRPRIPMPGLPPWVPTPRHRCDLDTQNLELQGIPTPDRPSSPRPLPPTRMPTTTPPWLGTLRVSRIQKLGPHRQQGLLVYHLLLPAQHQRQMSLVCHPLPGHPPLPHQPSLLALLLFRQARMERSCGATFDLHPGYTFSCPAICSQLLRWWPSSTTTGATPTPTEPDTSPTSTWPIPTYSHSCSGFHRFPDGQQPTGTKMLVWRAEDGSKLGGAVKRRFAGGVGRPSESGSFHGSCGCLAIAVHRMVMVAPLGWCKVRWWDVGLVCLWLVAQVRKRSEWRLVLCMVYQVWCHWNQWAGGNEEECLVQNVVR